MKERFNFLRRSAYTFWL